MNVQLDVCVSNPCTRSCTWLSFPTTKAQVQEVLRKIGVDGIRERDVWLTEHDSNLSGFCHCLTQYDPIDELNHLVLLLSALSSDDLKTFQAVIDAEEHCGNAKDLINLAQNLDCYEFMPDVMDDEELGRIYAEDMECIEISEAVRPYFDFEAYGRDTRINEGGLLVQDGYLRKTPTAFRELYHGPREIPPEHRVFTYPKLSIRERLAACKEISTQTKDAPSRPKQGRGQDR